MYVIFEIEEEQDYGYGGWNDSYTKYFHVLYVTEDEQKARDKVEELSKNSKHEYDYEWAETI